MDPEDALVDVEVAELGLESASEALAFAEQVQLLRACTSCIREPHRRRQLPRPATTQLSHGLTSGAVPRQTNSVSSDGPTHQYGWHAGIDACLFCLQAPALLVLAQQLMGRQVPAHRRPRFSYRASAASNRRSLDSCFARRSEPAAGHPLEVVRAAGQRCRRF